MQAWWKTGLSALELRPTIAVVHSRVDVARLLSVAASAGFRMPLGVGCVCQMSLLNDLLERTRP